MISHNNISCSAFSPSQHSSIHILSLSRSKFHCFLKQWQTPSDLPHMFSFPYPSSFVCKEKDLLFICFPPIHISILISYFLPFFFLPPFPTRPFLKSSLSHLPLSPSFLPLTAAQVKSDRWRPNADTLRPGPATFLLSGILYQDSKTGSIPPTEVEPNRKTK